jgi:hypothetical protein
METDFEASVVQPKPRTTTVLVLLLTAALTLSYLWAYAISAALVTADVIHPWSTNDDPRFGWLIKTFIGFCILFAAVAGAARTLSQRQLRNLDAMADE